MFTSVPFAMLCSMAGAKWLGGCWMHCWFASELRSLKPRELASFTMGCKQTCLSLAPGGHIIFVILDGKQTRTLLHRKILFLSSKAVCHTNILEKTVPLLTRYAEMSETHRDLSPDSLTLTEAADSVGHALSCSLPTTHWVTPGWQPISIMGMEVLSALEIMQIWERIHGPRATC